MTTLVLVLLYAEGFKLHSLALVLLPFYVGCLALYVFMRFVNRQANQKTPKVKPKLSK